MSPITIRQGSLDFLKRLARNNNRDWFNKNKDKYLEARDNLIAFADALLFEMNKHDRIETLSGKDSLYRIYKDVRFSKDKTPYNTHWSAAFKRATQKLRGGYYFKIKPGGSGLAGGFWGPGPQDLKRIRQDIDINYHDWRKMLNGKKLVTAFGGIFGEQVGSAPRGYTRDHPAIDLLRYKQFLLRREFTDAEVCSRRFLYEVNDSFKQMRPFLNYMSEVLTTDANGESLI
ncbi:MAG: DUF2461 domain-containing protein [Bacteroidota bacterium]|nr:DUF2461 domain-containing protein [Bacteroidota bacterium]MDP4254020.1 DUF2461 domain-containing protein [Bacteroidota bacterium]MDP4259322.1 DUF2461 domain-containing protein [Bacteroidota bacterium]